MLTESLDHAAPSAGTAPHERLTWGAIELQVTDLERSSAFWQAALGLRMRARQGQDAVALGTASDTLVVLRAGALQPAVSEHAGLYHLALEAPDQRAFSRLMARLASAGIAHHPTDHTMSKAIYLRDPDGLGIEISLLTPERFGSYGDMDSGFAVVDATGRRRSGRDPLDIAWELAQAEGCDPGAPIEDGASIAHLHLHVPELEPATRFFASLGFVPNLFLPKQGFADMSTGGACTHRLGVNTWAGRGVAPAPEGTARLVGYTLQALDGGVFERARLQLRESSRADRLVGIDPAGVRVEMAAPHGSGPKTVQEEEAA